MTGSPLRRVVLLAAMLFGATTVAQAQGQDERRFDLKPLVPPMFQLPPNAQLTPGGLGRTPMPGDRTPQFNNSSQQPPAPGLRLTIPTTPQSN